MAYCVKMLIINVSPYLRWAVIIGSTAVLRTIITVPLAIYQNKVIAEIELRQPTVSMMTEALKHRVVAECRKLGVTAYEADRVFKKRVGYRYMYAHSN